LTNQGFEECLAKKKIVPFPRAKKFALKELTAAGEDLAEARDRFAHRRYKYATINAYYAVFHAARALVYSKGYRERSHHCLGIALEALFVDQGLLAGRYVRMFQNTMASREEADYSGSYSQEGASLCIQDAEEFIRVALRLLRPRR